VSLPEILIVDDDRLIRMMIRDALADVPCQVREIDSGEGALALIKQHQPAAVLLDLVMPGKSGLEILRELRMLPLRTRIFILSGLDSESLVQQALSYGAHGFLTKPIHPLDVQNVVRGAIEAFGEPL
jgi:two-component system chemotaxis response regulator CheY